MEVLRRRKDEDKSEKEKEKEKQDEEKLRHGKSGVSDETPAEKKVSKDDSLEKMLHQQLKDWEKEKIEAEIDSQKERPTLHNIELPNLRVGALGVWRALHEACYPAPKDVAEDLEASGIPVHIQERFQIGFTDKLMEVAQYVASKFKPEELQVASFNLLADWAKKNVPILVFPYFRDDEVCFISCRAFLSKEERDELNIPRYVRLGEKIPFPYNANVFTDILSRERKKVFFLYPSRYRLNILSKEEDVLIVAEKGFDAIAIRGFEIEEDWFKLFVQVEPVVIVDPSDRTYPDWEKKIEFLKNEFEKREIVMRLEILPEGVDIPAWFVKSNLGERKVKIDRPQDKKKIEEARTPKEWGSKGIE